MSNASGIAVAPQLKSAFESARRSWDVAFLKVQIVADQLEAVHTEKKAGGGWARDYDSISRHLDDDVPCFVIFWKRREELILLSYVPEASKAKDKMAYSSSKGALNSLLNARQFAGSGMSNSSSKAVEQIFADSKAGVSHRAYTSHAAVKGPMSEVEEALKALPRQLDRKEFSSQGFSLLANITGKPLPPQLKNYQNGGGRSFGNQGGSNESVSLFRSGGGAFNIHLKPSHAREANKPNGGGFNPNRPPPGAQVLPGFGTAASKNLSPSVSSPTSASSASSASPTASSSASVVPVRRLSVSTGKCLVATCDNRRFKNGYCKPCMDASDEKREKLAAQSKA